MADLPSRVRHGIPFRSRLLISSLLGAVPLIVFGIILLMRQYHNRRDFILQTNLALAQVASASVDGFIGGNIRTLKTLAGSSEVKSGDLGEIQGLVDRQAAVQPDWENLSVADADGRMIAGKLKPLVSLRERDYFQQVKRTQEPAVSNLLISYLGHKPVIAIGVPILRNGVFAGSVNATLRAERILPLFSRVSGSPVITLSLWGNDRRLIASSQMSQRQPGWRIQDNHHLDRLFSGRAGILIGASPMSHTPTLYGYAPVRATPWVVIGSTPVKVGLAPNIRNTAIFVVLALVGLALTVWWSLYSANQLGDRVARLARWAHDIGEGRLAHPLVLHTGDELEDLANSLNQMAAELAGLDRLKSELVTMVSHELKTPLTSIRASLDMLASGLVRPKQPEYAETLEIAVRQSRHLQEMIESLIEVSRLRAGEMEITLSPNSLAFIIDTSLRQQGEAIHARGLALRVEVPEDLEVMADAQKVALALNNLLDNAVKFTDQGAITVRAERTEIDAVVTISDTGIGFDAETQAHLFEPFYQAEPLLTRRAGGVGLGLWVVRAIVEANGGRVFARSDGPGQGSTFGFTLPLAPPE